MLWQHKAWCVLAALVALGCQVDVGHAQIEVTGEGYPQIKPWGQYPETIDVPLEYVLFNESTLSVLDRVATPGRNRSQRTVIFTTLRFGDEKVELVMGMLATFCYHLNRNGMLQHTMLITTDEHTFNLLHVRGFPVFLDRAFPRRAAYIDNVSIRPETDNREFDVQKHWWGWRMASLGYRVLYMDSDAVVLDNPLLPFETNYDVQGLTDWFDKKIPYLGRAFTLNSPCSLYLLKRDYNLPSGTSWTESWKLDNLPEGEMALLTPNPCQSTGLWYLQPTDVTVEFMRTLVDRIAYHIVYEWDQTAWNDIILHFLWGAGEDEPLRYRLLPASQFANLELAEKRREVGIKDNYTILHLGGLHGSEKKDAWVREGYWMPDFTWERRVGGGAGQLAVSSSMSIGIQGGWGMLTVVSVGLVGVVYYWRSRHVVAPKTGLSLIKVFRIAN